MKLKQRAPRIHTYSEHSSDDEEEPSPSNGSKIVKQIQRRAPSPNAVQTETCKMDLDLDRPTIVDEKGVTRRGSYNASIPYIFTFMIISLITTTITALYFKYEQKGFWDSCIVQRFDELLQPVDDVGRANVIVFRVSIFIVAIMLILFVLGNNKNWLNRLYHVLFTGAWYYCTWNFVTFLKMVIADTSCNKHANSVSGHFNFFIFSLFSLFFLNSKLMPTER
jgi:hypothetical protein